MREIKKGDIVSRNSYGNDIIFSVKRTMKLANKKEVAILKGIDVRVEADAPLEDLKIVSKEEQLKREKELEQRIIYKIEREGSFKEKVMAILQLIVPLFVSSFQRADDLENAMEARGYNPGGKRVRYKQLKLVLRDYIMLLCVFGLVAGLIAIKVTGIL